MTEYLAVFRSRAQAADCISRLKNRGVPAVLINTPKEANVGCGLSVKFPQNAFTRVRQIASGGNYSAFYGFFAIKKAYGKTFLQRL